jgi:hypothetical protein
MYKNSIFDLPSKFLVNFHYSNDDTHSISFLCYLLNMSLIDSSLDFFCISIQSMVLINDSDAIDTIKHKSISQIFLEINNSLLNIYFTRDTKSYQISFIKLIKNLTKIQNLLNFSSPTMTEHFINSFLYTFFKKFDFAIKSSSNIN